MLLYKKYILLFLFISSIICNTEYLVYTKESFQNSALLISNLHSNEVPSNLQLNTDILYKEILDSLNLSINDYLEIEIASNPELKYFLIIGDENIIEPQYFYGTATDDMFSKMIINNYPMPQLITGRIIANNNEEAEFQITKIKNYILNPEDGFWRNEMLLLADDEFQNGSAIREEKYHTYFSNKIFKTLSEYIPVNNLFGTNFPRVQTSDWYLQPEFTQTIINKINSGIGIINYIGHGTHEIMSTENILSLSRDLDLFYTNNKPPIWIVGTCSFGDYIDKNCFAEALLKKEDAAISVISTTNGISPESNWHYLKNFFNVHLKNYILNNTEERLGELFFKAKQSALDLAISNQYPHNIYSGYRFNIFGDPALPLLISSADHLAEIDTINIGSENHLELNNYYYSGLKVFDEDILDYKSFNHNINGENYNPALLDSCIEYPNSINPITNEFYSCTDTLTFNLNGAKLFQGNFFNSIDFYIPLEVDLNNYLKSYIYNQESNNISFIQNIPEIPIAILNDSLFNSDLEGPDISIFFNNNELFNSGVIYSPYNFIITLKDQLPINLSGLNFHDIRFWIDDNQSNSIVLNDYFVSDENSDTSGSIDLILPDSLFQNNTHSINIEAWDIFNNNSIKTLSLNNNEIINAVFNVYNFPNPFSDNTYFTFNLKEAQPIYINLKIYNKNGSEIISFNDYLYEQKNFYAFPENGWNGFSKQNKKLPNGTYFYNLNIGNINNETIYNKVRTFTILR